MDKTLYDDYLCLVASKKQQIQWIRIWKKSRGTLLDHGNSEVGATHFSEHEAVIAMKTARINQ